MTIPNDFFKPKPAEITPPSARATDSYFNAVTPKADEGLPASVESDTLIDFDDRLLLPAPRANRGLKWLLATLAVIFIAMLGWDIAEFSQQLWQQSKALGLVFSTFLVLLAGLIFQQLLLLRRNNKHLKQVDILREAATRLQNEQHSGNAQHWLHSLQQFYQHQPQSELLAPCITQLPDYLNDSEVVNRISDDFFQQLDKQALRVVERTSVSSAALIAISQLAVVDSLLVVWKTLNMINQINLIYGVRLNRLAQWRLNLRVAKIALGSYASQAGISFFSEQVGLGLGGKVLGSVAQGFGVGLYQARIGISAMQQIRPVAFRDDQRPKTQMFAKLLRRKLHQLTKDNE